MKAKFLCKLGIHDYKLVDWIKALEKGTWKCQRCGKIKTGKYKGPKEPEV